MKLHRKIQLFTSLTAVAVLAGLGQSSNGQSIQTVYSMPTAAARDSYTGDVGFQIQVGSTNVVVSHLGVFDQSGAGLAVAHTNGIFSSTHALLAQANFAAGNAELFTNGFQWMPLDPPVLLASNTTYIVMGSVGNLDGDVWQDTFTPTWNTVFVGTTATTTRHAIYGPGGTPQWPPTGFSQNGNNNTYGNVCFANIPIDQARAGVQTTNLAISAGQTLTITGFASGQPPINYQWYLGSLSSPLSGQTNASLVIPNSAVGNSGTYFLVAGNSLGSEQSSNVTVSVTSIPVTVTLQPTNTTVYQNYTASFSAKGAGTQPIYYQWFRNGNAISGATSSNYTLVANITNNGDIYYCQTSNYISSVPYVANTSNAVLTVLYNLAQPQEFLHGFNSKLGNNTYGGQQGGQFTVGSNSVLVTHLGFYAWPGNSTTNSGLVTCTLNTSHHVGIFNANGTNLLGSVLIPAGSNSVLNGYMWQPLTPPLVLSSNTQYLLVAETFTSGDPWGDTYPIPDLNPYFATNSDATYSGAAWGQNPTLGGAYSGQMYSAPNMAVLALPTPTAFVVPDGVTNYVGFSASLDAVVEGQPPVTLQWYEEPGTQLTGQTNLLLNFPNLTPVSAGSYYVIANNTNASGQSPDAIVTVLPDVGPSITQDISPQRAYVYQTVQFSATADGTPDLLYQWTFNGDAIPGATNSVLTLNNVSAADAGNYQLLVTNGFGNAESSVAGLSVTTPTFGSYASAVLSSNLLLYYSFSDVSSGIGIATNDGSLGIPYNGIYEGNYSIAPGPFANSDPNNMAVSLDGLTADVLIPPLANVTVSNCTIAAWVDDVNNPQSVSGGNEAIFFQRNSSILGLAVNPLVAGAGDQLRLTWAGTVHDSGFVLPTNQWAFVAASISPTNITIAMQNGSGLQTTNFPGSYVSATFSGNSYVGWDTAGGSAGRRWTGPIDEVMLFNQALPASALNALYLGVPASATLTIAREGANVVITWPGGTLQQASNIAGPWSATVGATNGVYTVAPSGILFYRVQLQ